MIATFKYVIQCMAATFALRVAERGEYASVPTAPMPEGYKRALEAQKASRVAVAPDYSEQMGMIRQIRKDHAPLMDALAAFERVSVRDAEILTALAASEAADRELGG